jgi:hypothetical protein
MRTINSQCLTFEQDLWKGPLTLRNHGVFCYLLNVFSLSFLRHRHCFSLRHFLSQVAEARLRNSLGSGISFAIIGNLNQAFNEGAVREI